MKKVLLIVFMFVLTIPVYGLENVKYKYYRLNRVNGPLVFKNEVNEEFPLIDEENPIKGELSELSLEKPELKDGREIYEYDGYHYLQIPLIDEIEIRTDSLSSISQIRISLLNGEEEVESAIKTTITYVTESKKQRIKEWGNFLFIIVWNQIISIFWLSISII